ncbi:hypothetical protein ACIQCN_13765 [Pseudarthrobacter sp. NPDC092424]|uniref:hypothetical protein n=1 Tax=Pseudarthrobacter sp. NPDC092424 TaxID=3364415 RepID=UPI0038161470
MTESTSVNKAARRLRAARNVYLTSQIATLDLVELSEREATRLDHAAYRARRLAEHLGVPTLAADQAHDLYESIRAMSEALDSTRARKAASESTSEPGEKSTSETNPPWTAETQPDDYAEMAKFAEVAAVAERLTLEAGLPEWAVFVAFRRVIRLERERSRSEFMLESLFVSSVSQFEAFILRVISASLLFNPHPLNDSDRKFEFKEITALPDIESFVKSAVDAYADSLMRESMQKWMAFLARATRSDTTWMSELLEEPMMALRNQGCSEGLKPPASSRLLAV